jgi:Secretion system C-terminal sorting domain
MKYFIYIFFIFNIGNISGQSLHDNNWVLGGLYWPNPYFDSLFSVTSVDFNSNQFHSGFIKDSVYFVGMANTSVSDTAGNLKLCSNGIWLCDKSRKKLKNTSSFQNLNQYPNGLFQTQGVLLLPTPSKQDEYLFFDSEVINDLTNGDVYAGKARYTRIKEVQNDSMVATQVNQVMVGFDTTNMCQHTACKHANGRDWWFFRWSYKKKKVYKFLITPDSMMRMADQNFNITPSNGFGQAAFSPDGKWYAYGVEAGFMPYYRELFLYQFDRCTGTLSEPLYEYVQNEIPPPGVVFSPDSRLMYHICYDTIYQYNLYAPDIFASRQVVAVYDGWKDERNFPIRFFYGINAPDGKIYINVPNFNTRWLHVIDQPNVLGAGCNVIQHAIQLPTFNTWSLPNFPHYRLFDEQGSPCDTLVTVQTPTQPEPELLLRVYPNPATDYLYFSVKEGQYLKGRLSIMDVHGRSVYEQTVTLDPWYRVQLNWHLPTGVYYYIIEGENNGKRHQQKGKVVITQTD